jgi:hypothetical protein
MDDLLSWLEKRVSQLRDKKAKEEAKSSKDLEFVKRIGGKLSGYKEVLTYIKSHK